MKEVIVIKNIHSFIDVITNSSTELFVCDTDKTLSEVTALVKEKEEDWPSPYGYNVHVDTDKAEEYNDFGYDSYDIPQMIEYLESCGYKVEEPVVPKKVITISCERGTMNDLLREWILETFDAEIISM
jgi:hypothetical protein